MFSSDSRNNSSDISLNLFMIQWIFLDNLAKLPALNLIQFLVSSHTDDRIICYNLVLS